jgi:hypothetical protein
MGYGKWSSDVVYYKSNLRATQGFDDFQHDKDFNFGDLRDIHEALLPSRINKKPFKKLESRDSKDHPESLAIVICLDVTGSNINNARVAQKALPKLMDLLAKHIPNPQVAIWANDDYLVVGNRAFQASDFESDDRIDEWLRDIKLVGKGGGNNRESYDLPLYCAAYKTVLDCFEKRHKKGLLFLYADEMFPDRTVGTQLVDVFGDQTEKSEKIETLVKKAQKLWDVYQLWPLDGGEQQSRERGIELFGADHVITLRDGKDICSMVGVVVGAREGKINKAQIKGTLVELGVEDADTNMLADSLSTFIDSTALNAGENLDRVI